MTSRKVRRRLADADWDRYQLTARIVAILACASRRRPHHFGLSYMSAYQLAIGFATRHAEDFAAIGLLLGGQGIREHESFAQELAHGLSSHISHDADFPIEGAFFAKQHLRHVIFSFNNQIVRASKQSDYAFSMFRLREPVECRDENVTRNRST